MCYIKIKKDCFIMSINRDALNFINEPTVKNAISFLNKGKLGRFWIRLKQTMLGGPKLSNDGAKGIVVKALKDLASNDRSSSEKLKTTMNSLGDKDSFRNFLVKDPQSCQQVHQLAKAISRLSDEDAGGMKESSQQVLEAYKEARGEYVSKKVEEAAGYFEKKPLDKMGVKERVDYANEVNRHLQSSPKKKDIFLEQCNQQFLEEVREAESTALALHAKFKKKRNQNDKKPSLKNGSIYSSQEDREFASALVKKAFPGLSSLAFNGEQAGALEWLTGLVICGKEAAKLPFPDRGGSTEEVIKSVVLGIRRDKFTLTTLVNHILQHTMERIYAEIAKNPQLSELPPQEVNERLSWANEEVKETLVQAGLIEESNELCSIKEAGAVLRFLEALLEGGDIDKEEIDFKQIIQENRSTIEKYFDFAKKTWNTEELQKIGIPQSFDAALKDLSENLPPELNDS